MPTKSDSRICRKARDYIRGNPGSQDAVFPPRILTRLPF